VFTLAAALAMGLLPILVPGLYSKFPANAQLILGNGLAMGTITAVLLNILFHHVGRQPVETPSPSEEATKGLGVRPAESI
jgi:xanthine/uracil permease